MDENKDQQRDSENRRDGERWKFNKEIGVVDLITIVSALLAVVYSYTTLDKRVAIVEGAIPALIAADSKGDEDTRRVQDRMEKQMELINQKLDRILERREK